MDVVLFDFGKASSEVPHKRLISKKVMQNKQ